MRIVLSLTNLSECGSWDFVSVLVKAFFFCEGVRLEGLKISGELSNLFMFGFWLRNLRKVKLYFRGGNEQVWKENTVESSGSFVGV